MANTTGLFRGRLCLVLNHDGKNKVLNALGLPQGSLRSSLAGNVRHHGARPWHPRELGFFACLAASVRVHGARPWHLWEARMSANTDNRRESIPVRQRSANKTKTTLPTNSNELRY